MRRGRGCRGRRGVPRGSPRGGDCCSSRLDRPRAHLFAWVVSRVAHPYSRCARGKRQRQSPGPRRSILAVRQAVEQARSHGRARRRSPPVHARRRSRRPRSPSRHEIGRAPRADPAPCCRSPFLRARRLVVGPDVGAIDEGHAQGHATRLHQLGPALPYALPRPADEQLRRQPPGAELGRDAAPLGPILAPPEYRRNRPPQFLRRCRATRAHLLDQPLPYCPDRIGEDPASASMRHARSIGRLRKR